MNEPSKLPFEFSDEFRRYKIYANRWIAYSGAMLSLALIAIVSVGQEGWVVVSDMLLVVFIAGFVWWTIRVIGINSKLNRMRRQELEAYKARSQA
jgi:hypothetical protein